MKRITPIVFALSLVFASTAIPCEICKYSPHNWGFCRPATLGSGDGWQTCTEVVVDTFNGTTDCNLQGADCLGTLGGVDGNGGDGGCWWTDLNGGCILAY
jgi:hypothetical protein